MILATEEEVCIFRNMFCEIKSIVFKIKILTCLLLCRSFRNIFNSLTSAVAEFPTSNSMYEQKQPLKKLFCKNRYSLK